MINDRQLAALRQVIDTTKALAEAHQPYFTTARTKEGAPIGFSEFSKLDPEFQLWVIGVALQQTLIANLAIASTVEQLVIHQTNLPDRLVNRLHDLTTDASPASTQDAADAPPQARRDASPASTRDASVSPAGDASDGDASAAGASPKRRRRK